jgi:adenosylhomocysteinase
VSLLVLVLLFPAQSSGKSPEPGQRKRPHYVRYTPALRAQLKTFLDQRKDLTYRQIARDLNSDPSFGPMRNWTVDQINELVARYPEFPRRLRLRVKLDRRLWTDLHGELLAHPDLSYPQMARLLENNPTFRKKHPGVTHQVICGAIQKFAPGDQLSKERDRALAAILADRLDKMSPALPLKTRVKTASEGLQVGFSRFLRLREHVPDLLGNVVAPPTVDPLTRSQKTRVRALMLRHPTVAICDLGPILSRDPALKKISWDKPRLQRLQHSSWIPTRTERQGHLATITAEALEKEAGSTPLEKALSDLRIQHPGLTLNLLERLSGDHLRLRTALQRLTHSSSVSTRQRHGVSLDDADALTLRFKAAHIEETLRRPGSRALARIVANLRQAEREQGNNDGTLSPRDLAGADPAVRAVMASVWRKLGKRNLPLRSVEKALPGAVAQVLTRRNVPAAVSALRRTVAGEAVTALADAWSREGLTGETLARPFQVTRVYPDSWSLLKRKLPDLFPHPSSSIDTIAAIYGQVVAGRLTPKQFYSATGLTAARLRELQVADPAHFPRISATTNMTLPNLARPLQVEAHLPTGSAAPTRQSMRPDVVAIARRAYEADPLVQVDDIVRAINATPGFVKRFGRMNKPRYEGLQREPGSPLPDLTDGTARNRRLLGEVEQLVAKGLSEDAVLARMTARYPRFTKSRLKTLKKLRPDLFGRKRHQHDVDRRRRDAELLSARWRATAKPITDIADELARRDKTWNRSYAHRLTKEFRAELFSELGKPPPTDAYKLRKSLPVREVLRLATRVAPPGTDWNRLVRVANGILGERGLPSLDRSALLHYGLPSLRWSGARWAAEVVAEYARAALPGTGHQAILDQVVADYSTLTAGKLATFERMWRENPKAYPALSGFFSGGKLRLVGLNRRPLRPRFLGGWDPARALLGGSSRRRAELAIMSQSARIPLRLPLLDLLMARERVAERRPLARAHVLVVSHMLGSNFPLFRALRAAGASSAIVVGTPYGTNRAVRRAVRAEGFDVRVPRLDPDAYEAAVKKAIDDLLARRKKDRPIVVLDDGGLVAKIIHTDPAYAGVRRQFKIVEQTTQGLSVADGVTLEAPVIAAARSRSKLMESRFIGRAVAVKVRQAIDRAGGKLDGKRVVVVGYGWVGRAVARELKAGGARVTVVERSPTRRRSAARRYDVSGLQAALPAADVVIGTTGETSLRLEHLRLLKSGALVASASSKQIELDMKALRREASRREVLGAKNPLVRLPTARYRLGGRSITVLGDGWPVNFDGDVEDIPPVEIQITRALMLAGALQAMKLRPGSAAGVIPLDRKLDWWLVRQHHALLRASRGQARLIGDPDRWADTVLDLGRRF